MPKKYTEARREIKLSLPESLLIELDLLFYDPVRSKPIHGARSEFISQAIREKLSHQKQENSTP